MGQANRESGDDDVLEFVRLIERMRVAAPERMPELMRMLRGIVEGQELIGAFDNLLVLRRRVAKRYRA